MEKGKEYWNKEAYNWLHSTGNSDVPSKVRRKIQEEYLSRVPKNGVVLNLGSGCEDLSLEGWSKDKVIALDYSTKMLLLNDYGMKIEADARERIPMAQETVDSVCSFFLMRYLSKEEQVQLVLESVRVLKAGGVLLIVDVPDNTNPQKVEPFNPTILLDYFPETEVEVLKAGVEEWKFTKYISTGFGGWDSESTCKIGVLMMRKN